MFVLLRHRLVHPGLPLLGTEAVPAGRYDLAETAMIGLDVGADRVVLAHFAAEDDEGVPGAADVGLWAASAARGTVGPAGGVTGRHMMWELVCLIERGAEGRRGQRG